MKFQGFCRPFLRVEMQKMVIRCPHCHRTALLFYLLSQGNCSHCGMKYRSNLKMYRRISGIIAIPCIYGLYYILTDVAGMNEFIAIALFVLMSIASDFIFSCMFVRIEPAP